MITKSTPAFPPKPQDTAKDLEVLIAKTDIPRTWLGGKPVRNTRGVVVLAVVFIALFTALASYIVGTKIPHLLDSKGAEYPNTK